jgi:hypothetical protein
MVAMYIIPGSGSTLTPQEWIMAGAWALIGAGFYIHNKRKYKERFGYIEGITCVAEHGRRCQEKVYAFDHSGQAYADKNQEERQTA